MEAMQASQNPTAGNPILLWQLKSVAISVELTPNNCLTCGCGSPTMVC